MVSPWKIKYFAESNVSKSRAKRIDNVNPEHVKTAVPYIESSALAGPNYQTELRSIWIKAPDTNASKQVLDRHIGEHP
jgi:hypothetical protein